MGSTASYSHWWKCLSHSFSDSVPGTGFRRTEARNIGSEPLGFNLDSVTKTRWTQLRFCVTKSSPFFWCSYLKSRGEIMPILIEFLPPMCQTSCCCTCLISCDPKKVKEWIFTWLLQRKKWRLREGNELGSHSECMAERDTGSGVSDAIARGWGPCDLRGWAASILLGHLLERHLLNHDSSF